MERKHLVWAVALLVFACDRGGTDPGPTTTPSKAASPPEGKPKVNADDGASGPVQDDGAATPDRLADGLRGQVFREGEPLGLASATLAISGKHCREPDVPKVTIRIDATKDVDPVIVITGDTTTAKLGEKMKPRTDDDRAGDRPVGIAVYASGAGRGAEHRLPKTAWVRFHSLALGGPVDVDFEADFGEHGKLDGALRVETTEETTCVIPAPPPPPPG